MIPAELKSRPQWVLWRRIVRKGKATKMPFQANGKPARSNDPTTWTDFTAAVAALKTKRFDGIGFMFAEGDGLAGIDLDHVIDLTSGEIDPRALAILERFPGAYVEFSPSGDGLHVWAMGKPGRCGKGTAEKWIEVYDYTSPRYLTVTGRPYGLGGGIVEAQAGFDWLHQAYFLPAPHPEGPRHALPANPGSPAASGWGDRELIEKASKRGKFAKLWAGDWEGRYPSQSEADAALCGLLAFWTGGDAGWMDRLFRDSGLMRPKWDSKRGDSTYGTVTIDHALAITTDRFDPARGQRRPRDKGAQDGKSGRAKRHHPPPEETTADDDRRPFIKLKGGALNRVLDQIEGAVAEKSAPPFFQRGGSLVRVVFLDQDSPGHVARRAGTPQLAEVSAGWLCCEFQRAARFLRWDARRGDWTEVDLPERYAKIFLDRRDWRAPVLQSVVESPLLRLDGTIHGEPGYDSASRCWFHLEAPFEMPQRVDGDDVHWAVELYRELLAEFPFEAPHDLSALLAAILTDLIRPLLPLAPMFAMRAPVAGSGKTLLGRIVSLITTGRNPSVIAHPGDEIEFSKSVFAALLGGDRILFIDNIEEILESPTLCAVVTSEEFNGRLLGRSQMMKVSTRVTWLLTGNNLQVRGDLKRRILTIDLDPQMEKPEERTFERDIIEHLKAQRADYLRAALIILLNHVQAGSPDLGLTLGSFEIWSRWVRAPLVYAGLPDPCLGLADWEETDSFGANLRELLRTWDATDWGHLPMRASEIVTRSGEWPELKDALMEICSDSRGNLSPRILGRWLARWVNRIEGGLRLERAGFDNHHKSNQFRVVKLH